MSKLKWGLIAGGVVVNIVARTLFWRMIGLAVAVLIPVLFKGSSMNRKKRYKRISEV